MGIIDLVKLKRLHEISLADESQKKYAEKFNDDPIWCKLNSIRHHLATVIDI